MEVSRRACTENTRTEILENLMKWSEDRHVENIYWMNGMAGTGKTTIAYSASTTFESSKQLAASFFCTRTSPECRDAKRIVPTIAYQLARRSAPFRSALCKILEEDTDIGTGTISAQFEQLLKKPLMEAQANMPNNLVVVVDALDECSDPYIVELFLGVLFRSVLDLPIKFLVISRPEPMIRHRMMSESERSRSILYLHEIEQTLVQADIELYLKEELASMVPTNSDIKQLAKRAGKLFIYAATAVRYIRPPGRSVNSRERLRTILGANTEPNMILSPIDMLYTVILTAAIEDEALEPKEQVCMLHVLWTIVSAREPVFINTIAEISGVRCKDKVVAALEPMRSVLHISENNDLVTTLHASFPDYILNQERSGRFACDIPKHNLFLSMQCFEIMKTQLRFNICNLESSFIPDNQVPSLEKRVKANISEELFYACRFWMDHLGSVIISDSQSLVGAFRPSLRALSDFLSQRLMFWMEVMNLKKCMHIGIMATSSLNAWLSRIADGQSQLSRLASNIQVFVTGYASRPVSNYTPHIYLSALPFSPSLFHYLPQFKGLVKISGSALNKIRQDALNTWESESIVLSTLFLPKGDRIVLGNKGGELSVQNVHDGRHVFQPIKAHKGPITCVGISRDGTQIVIGSQDKTISVRSSYDGSLVLGPFLGHIKGVTSVSFSPDTTHIASGSEDCTVGIWVSHDAATPMRSLTGHTATVNSVAFSPDGTQIVSGSSDKTVRVWDIFSGTVILNLLDHTQPVMLARFSSEGDIIVSFSLHTNRPDEQEDVQSKLCIWNASDGALIRLRVYREKLMFISPQGDQVVGSVNHTINVWDVQDDKRVAGPLIGHTAQITSISFSDDRSRLISASQDRTVGLWNVYGKAHHAREVPKSRGPRIYPSLATAAPNQASIAISTSDIYVFNLDLHYMTHITSPEIHNTILVQFSLDATRVFTVDYFGIIYIWDAHTARLVDGPHRCSSGDKIKSAACSADGARVATVYCDNDLRDVIEIWNTHSSQTAAFCVSTRSRANAIEPIFSLTRKRLLTHSLNLDGEWDVWDTDSGAHLTTPATRTEGSLAGFDLSPDGRYIVYYPTAVPAQNGLQLIDMNTEEVTTMPAWDQLSERQPKARVLAKLSRDGPCVVCCMGSECYIWNIGDQTVVAAVTDLATIPKCITCTDGWCLVSSISCTSDSRTLQARRFSVDKPFELFTLGLDGWIVDDRSQPLFWVPAEVRDGFPRADGINFQEPEVSLFVSCYSNMLAGNDWSKCYIGD
ncbi:hypothetical protein B0J17DRAFT_215697 [Rhizoctonia solani]|nr:hypothetical protein B0J17DRAFT_215697 [Rhizoctonia solani]